MTSAPIAPLPTDIDQAVDVLRIGGLSSSRPRKPLYDFIIDRESAGRVRVRLVGEIDLLAVADLRGTLDAATTSARQVTVDLADVTFINTRAVGVLVDYSSAHQGRIRVCGAQRSTRLLFELFGAVEMLSGDLHSAR